MIRLIESGTISSKIAKQLFKILVTEGGDADVIVQERGMAQISDPAQIQAIIAQVLEANQASVEDYRNGKDRAVGFLVGQIMKVSKGQANPQVVNQLLIKTLQTFI